MSDDYRKILETQNIELREIINTLQDEKERIIGVLEEVQDIIYTIDVGIVDYITHTKKCKGGTYNLDDKSMNTIRGKEFIVNEDLNEMLTKIQQVTGEQFDLNFFTQP